MKSFWGSSMGSDLVRTILHSLWAKAGPDGHSMLLPSTSWVFLLEPWAVELEMKAARLYTGPQLGPVSSASPGTPTPLCPSTYCLPPCSPLALFKLACGTQGQTLYSVAHMCLLDIWSAILGAGGQHSG